MANNEEIKGQGEGTQKEVAEDQREYDATWEQLKKQEDGEKDATVDDNAKNDLPPENQGASDVGVIEPKQAGEVKSEKYGTVKSMEKALDDTKAYAHRLESEKSELAKKIDELQKGGATQAEVAEAKQAVQDAQDDLDAIKTRVYEDYPELQQLIDPIIKQNKILEEKLVSFEETKTKKTEQDHKQSLIDNFNKNVKPKVLEVHSDFDSLIQSEAYWAWAEKQRPGLRTAALDSPDSDDIIWAVGEYKKEKASSQVPEIRDREKKERDAKLANSQTLRGGSTAFPGAKKNADPENYDWEGAGDILKKQGIGTG